MKGIIRAAAMALLFAPGVSLAEDFDAGLEAYVAGDYETAYEIWLSFAEQGDARAQYNLGDMYYFGQGVAQDYEEAVRWYRTAAEQGDVDAQYILGFMHVTHQGGKRDYVSAHMWFYIAARNGDSDAVTARNTVAEQMTPEAIADAQNRARICLESGYEDCD